MTGTKCRGVCDRFSISSSSYQDGKLRKCSICDIFVKSTYERCPCCKFKLRIKSKSSKDKRSKEGDQAFVLFDLAVLRTTNELNLLTKCYKIPNVGEGIIQSVFAYLQQAIMHYEILEQEHRQRIEYLDTKRKYLWNLLRKIETKTKEYWRKTANFQ